LHLSSPSPLRIDCRRFWHIVTTESVEVISPSVDCGGVTMLITLQTSAIRRTILVVTLVATVAITSPQTYTSHVLLRKSGVFFTVKSSQVKSFL